uniref:NADH:ubiquinone reductase (H(+)-translocating) n=1 Tax=Trioza erytreae TaxID=1778831 RepID=A0A6M8YBT3_TRIEB|nr:NADH dehydrogenase subunit 5 [Trioza erytreae]QKK36457.1 NADH dehydrogenase subunit 5 [Trioza erytreae]
MLKYLSKYEFVSFFLCLGSIQCFVMFMIFINYNLTYLYEFEVMLFHSIPFNFIIYLDWMSFMFIFVVLFISMLIMVYAKIYMGIDCHQFLWMTVLFVLFMVIMIMSPSSLGVLLGWDGLGIVSYCLVIYYKSYDSFNSGFITAATNRLGDSMLMLSITWYSMNGSFIFFETEVSVVFFMIACMTKSAQFPFCAWLPLAMAAPTPISSLVHSSTLVTAGVYMLIRFFNSFNSSIYLWLLLILSLLTVFIAGICAMKEFDLKRVVALSTLGQLGFMVVILSVGHPYVAFFHLIIHALFKALLFMCSGIIIHSSLGTQDLRKMGNINIDSIVLTCMIISLFNLMGMPFTSGFYSKDSLVELTYMNYSGFSIGLMMLMMIMITSIYTTRLIMYSCSSKGWIMYMSSNMKLSICIMILAVSNIFMGCFFNWIIQELDFIYLYVYIKYMPILMIIMGMMCYSLTFKNKKTEFFMKEMFYMMSITKMISLIFCIFYNLMKIMDQGWFESYLKNIKITLTKNSLIFSNISQDKMMFSLGTFLSMILMI